MFKILTILSAVLVGLNANAKPGQTYNWTDFESTDVYINILGQGSTEAAEQAAQNMIEALSQGEVPSNQIWAPFANDVDCNSAGAKSVISKYLKKQLNKGHQKVSGLSYTV